MNTKDSLIEQEFNEYYSNNTYDIASVELINRIIDFKPDQKVIKDIDFTLYEYYEYLESLDKLDKKTLKLYLSALKSTDIIDNQVVEMEDSFLIYMSVQSQKRHAIDQILNTKSLKEQSLLTSHGLLMEGTTSSHLDNYHFRNSNVDFVGHYEQGKRIIHFLPIDYREIKEAIHTFLDYYNDKSLNDIDMFIKAFKIHAIISTMQAFKDGNTRFGRLLQNAKLYSDTNNLLKKSYENPTLYITKAYNPYRSQYRELIEKIVRDKSLELDRI